MPEAWLRLRLPVVSVAAQARRFGAFGMHWRYSGQVVASFDASSDFIGAEKRILSVYLGLSERFGRAC